MSESQKHEEPQNEQEPAEKSYVGELDIASEEFNPLRALYEPGYRVSKKTPKVVYQNLAAFETALKKFGIWNLNKKVKTPASTDTAVDTAGQSSSKSLVQEAAQELNSRRFQPHQMTVKGTVKKRHHRNLYTSMAGIEGPLAALQKSLSKGDGPARLHITLRKEDGIRGSVEGELIAFDKQWNILMRNVVEVWRRRKHKYSEQKLCGKPQDCSAQLSRLGISLPPTQVKSLNRKNVELRRELPQVLVRGEQVVLINVIAKAIKEK